MSWYLALGGQIIVDNISYYFICFNNIPRWCCWYRNCLLMQETEETRSNPWISKISWRRKWQSTPVFLPGKLHGWKILVGYTSWGCKELDTIEHRHNYFILGCNGDIVVVQKNVLFIWLYVMFRYEMPQFVNYFQTVQEEVYNTCEHV